MSKSNDFEAAFLDLVFLNTNIANIGDATGLRGSSAAGSLYATMCTADPGETGTAVTNETAYTGYARKAIARGAGGFVRTGSSISPVADQLFAACTASPGAPLTHWAIVNTASGAGMVLYKGPLDSQITMGVGVEPKLRAASTIGED